MSRLYSTGFCLLLFTTPALVVAQEVKKPGIPHAQDKPADDPRDPQTATKTRPMAEAFSPDGRYLAIGAGESGDKFSHGEIRVLDLSSERVVVPDPKTLEDGAMYRDQPRKDSHQFGEIELRLKHATSRQPLKAMDPSGVFAIGEVSSIQFNERVLLVEAQPFSQDGK